jgi:hypothetical protein
MPATPSVTSFPSFIKGENRGYSNRTTYSLLYPVNTTYLQSTDNLFTILQTSFTNHYKGSNYVYVRQNTTYRFKMIFQYTASDVNVPLNIRFGFDDGSTLYYAEQDNTNSHVFATGSQISDCPVSFEGIINFCESNIISIDGFYQYTWESYDVGGNNTSTVYVPITHYDAEGIALAGNFFLSIYGSESNIKINYLTIEELG